MAGGILLVLPGIPGVGVRCRDVQIASRQRNPQSLAPVNRCRVGYNPAGGDGPGDAVSPLKDGHRVQGGQTGIEPLDRRSILIYYFFK
jgi:hypothetical protein